MSGDVIFVLQGRVDMGEKKRVGCNVFAGGGGVKGDGNREV